MKHALVACSDIGAARNVAATVGGAFHTDIVAGKDRCLACFRERRYDVALLDLGLFCCGDEPGRRPDSPVDYGRELQPFWDAFPAADIVVLTEESSVREAVRAVKAGASDYITFPVDPVELRYVLESVEEGTQTEAEVDYLREELHEDDTGKLARACSTVMKEVLAQVRLVAPTKTTVLLFGETGTGKSLLAKIIHDHSHRRDAPFVSVHCGAIPDTLVESELFGHEKGAFTGATQRRLGRFEVANGGTILLDEVSTLTPSAQIKLLQVLQDRTIQRVGSEVSTEVDVRVIAATNVDLKELCAQGGFRVDLFYRLNVFPIPIPALRDRREDIGPLADTLIHRLNRQNSQRLRGLTLSALAALEAYDWPGNVRELENLLERAFILEQSPVITPGSFPGEILVPRDSPAAQSPLDPSLTLDKVQQAGLDDIRRQYLKAQLKANGGRIDRTASAAGITPRHLHKLMTRYELRKEDFKPVNRRQAR